MMASTTTNEKNTILIPVDGSKNSHRAFTWYCEHLLKESDKLIIVHAYVVPPMQAAKHSSVDFKNQLLEWQILVQKAEEKAKNVLKPFEDISKSLKAQVSSRFLYAGGTPGEVVVKTAKEEGVSIIIIGSRGIGSIRRTILGSVSDYIVHHSNTPVIVVPP